MKVALDEPLDLLVHLIAEALREHRPKERNRRRLDSVGYQLEVFDLYESGMDFEEIAQELKRRNNPIRARTIKGVSNTVRSAYVAAKRKIYGSPNAVPDEIQRPHIYDTCPVCRKASKTEKFCRLGRKQLLNS